MVAFANELGLNGMLASGVTPWWHLSGVMHPAVAHFPIALLMVAALVESWSVIRRHRKPTQTTLLCLYLGTTAAVVAAVLGLANASASGEKGITLNWHKWLGICVATLAVLAAILSIVLVRRGSVRGRTRWAYRGGVFTSAALVGLVGSFGGKLVHGDTYYSDAFAAFQKERGTIDAGKPANTVVVQATKQPSELGTTAPAKAGGPATQPVTSTSAPLAALPIALPGHAPDLPPPAPTAAINLGGGQIDYARDIEPIFEANCVKCHNETKKKGGYRLDKREHVFAAGQSGKVAVLPGKSDESLLIKMVEGKGEFADSQMPPKGEPLTYQQIQLIRRWIDEGAQASNP